MDRGLLVGLFFTVSLVYGIYVEQLLVETSQQQIVR